MTDEFSGPAAGAFTASLLFDVLSLIAGGTDQSHAYQRAAADLLRLGSSTSLATAALELADYLHAPQPATAPNATRRFVLNGAIVAVYLLDVAARRRQLNGGRARVEPLTVGLSLLGLAFVGISARLE
jgi:uncharacterized membrane protein